MQKSFFRAARRRHLVIDSRKVKQSKEDQIGSKRGGRKNHSVTKRSRKKI
jgi:hypothetical protein